MSVPRGSITCTVHVFSPLIFMHHSFSMTSRTILPLYCTLLFVRGSEQDICWFTSTKGNCCNKTGHAHHHAFPAALSGCYLAANVDGGIAPVSPA